MRCPKCEKELSPLFAPEKMLIGVECPPCNAQWISERIERIGDDLRESMYRQLANIVRHMDFSEDCKEVAYARR